MGLALVHFQIYWLIFEFPAFFYLQPIYLKVDQCQPDENSWTACQSSQVVNWVKTKPELAGNQIPFGGTRFGFTTVGVYNTWIIDTYSSKTKSGSSEGNLISC